MAIVHEFSALPVSLQVALVTFALFVVGVVLDYFWSSR